MRSTLLLTIAVIIGIFHAACAEAQNFTIDSADLKERLTEDQVYAGYGCTGKNISPALTWADAPEATKSFAVTVFDPDARAGRGWWHWLIFNIPVSVRGLPTDAGNPLKKLAPEGSVQSMTDFGKPGFGGACPPPGDRPHRYIFTVYALDVEKLDFDQKTPPAKVASTLDQHAIARSFLTSLYGR